MANQDDSFIREVNEELRSDQMRAIWRKFGRVLIGAAVLLVLGTIGKVSYEYWRETEASAAGDRFLSALTLIREDKKEEGQKELAALEKDGFGAYPVLARMRSASLLAENGDTAGAVAAFTAIAKDGAIPQALRDAARLRAAYLLVDTASYEEVSAEAEQMTNPASAMRHSAREVLGLSAYKHGDFKRAKEWFEQITGDAESPRNVANRAQMMLDLITASGKAS
ncbi:tetratricopeptide repeat protein [Rhizobium sp. ARZ01]|uniref:tetratricopeptide repeat protein n=1 Tax=Rhizobium sp. ARZ01 TaxID=2769313 RepID=UPI001782B749|nr:tetratricopeptide repeat protein [Rhizobium sp. ARZ01]MBD9373143.1 tetratricopeptide repeat protein [Rhizobium sp. ARZ01]